MQLSLVAVQHWPHYPIVSILTFNHALHFLSNLLLMRTYTRLRRSSQPRCPIQIFHKYVITVAYETS